VAVGAFAVIGVGATIGARTIIHPHVVIGPGVEIGPDCLLHAHVSIRERCRLGARVVLQNGAVVGSDGFGFAHRDDGTHEKIPQAAIVVLEDDVEIGANSTVDRPAVGETRIRSGTKIDNLVQIAHGVVLGRNVLIAAQVGIAGSTIIEDGVMLGGQVGVAGHLTLGKGAIVSGQSGVTNSLEAGAFVTGYPAVPNREWRKASVLFRRLPELKKRVAELEARLAALESARESRVP
jgi:UDP-3-O-[3-hydroxymyristoyl] glucosamine N-acyltransferase